MVVVEDDRVQNKVAVRRRQTTQTKKFIISLVAILNSCLKIWTFSNCSNNRPTFTYMNFKPCMYIVCRNTGVLIFFLEIRSQKEYRIVLFQSLTARYSNNEIRETQNEHLIIVILNLLVCSCEFKVFSLIFLCLYQALFLI